jgi:RNA polymerase sigma-70 factor (ECF subfamily)
VIRFLARGHGAAVTSTSEPPVLEHSELPASPVIRAPDASPRNFSELVRNEIDFVWRSLRRSGLSATDADDATQQVFLVASRRSAELVPGKERSFLYGTARRIAANARRAIQRRREAPDELIPVATADTTPADGLLEQRRARALLDELLAQLPPELARVLVLCEVERLTLGEIAELEGIPSGTAASRVRRARAAFREQLEQHRDRNPFDERSP